MYVAVSQSGETFDTLAAVQEVRRKGGRVLGIVNVVGSPIARVISPILFRFIFHRILTADTAVGRKARAAAISKGGPLIRVKPADLTASKVADNPDGVMYYKVANGQPPKMPAFKGLMSRDEIWTVVEFAKSLRQSQ